jgi:hypothetical protein
VTGPEVVSPVAVDAAERLYEIATLMQIHGLPAPSSINLAYLPARIEVHLRSDNGAVDLHKWADVIDARIEQGDFFNAAKTGGTPWQEYHADGCGLHVWYAEHGEGPRS